MRYHSDQALDLANDSFIGIVSCYDHPDTKYPRVLQILNKTTNESMEISMDHLSCILFSTKTNRQYLHKIILPKIHTRANDQWLGLTFRQSKTFITYENDIPYIDSEHIPLTLADVNQRQEFLKCRHLENSLVDYIYPKITYTLSPGDLMLVND